MLAISSFVLYLVVDATFENLEQHLLRKIVASSLFLRSWLLED